MNIRALSEPELTLPGKAGDAWACLTLNAVKGDGWTRRVEFTTTLNSNELFNAVLTTLKSLSCPFLVLELYFNNCRKYTCRYCKHREEWTKSQCKIPVFAAWKNKECFILSSVLFIFLMKKKQEFPYLCVLPNEVTEVKRALHKNTVQFLCKRN